MLTPTRVIYLPENKIGVINFLVCNVFKRSDFREKI